MTTNTQGKNFTVTERAAKRIKDIMADEPSCTMLRLAVEGGGCSGFQYKFDLVATSQGDDLMIERDGATVLIDPMSLEFLSGSELDFVDDIIGASFQVRNPNASAGCGCGTSFSI